MLTEREAKEIVIKRAREWTPGVSGNLFADEHYTFEVEPGDGEPTALVTEEVSRKIAFELMQNDPDWLLEHG
jgi:hypothetical protein